MMGGVKVHIRKLEYAVIAPMGEAFCWPQNQEVK